MIGKPSAALAAQLEADEKDRLAKRKAEFGEEKLKELEKAVEKAKEESEIAPPPEMIGNFPITDVSLQYFQTSRLMGACESYMGTRRGGREQCVGSNHQGRPRRTAEANR